MKITKKKGYWHISFFDKEKQYTRYKTTHLPATESNRAAANRELRNFSAEEIKKQLTRPADINKITLEIGKQLYFESRPLRLKTKKTYDNAVKYFSKVIGDKPVYLITREDYKNLLTYMTTAGQSQTSQGILTAHLHALWNFFLAPDQDNPDKQFVTHNIIKPVKRLSKPPEPINHEVLNLILTKLKEKLQSPDKRVSSYHYYLIAFLVNTGARISTALTLQWENIKWDENMITMENVKIKNKLFQFPLTPALRQLFIEMGKKDKGKIFPFKDRESIKGFWYKIQEELQLESKYGIHRLRKTFLSTMANSGISIDDLSTITNTNPGTLRQFYVKRDIQGIGNKISNVKIYSIGNSKSNSKRHAKSLKSSK